MFENWGQRLSPTEIRASQMWTRVKVTSFRRLGQRGQMTGGNGHCLPPNPFRCQCRDPSNVKVQGKLAALLLYPPLKQTGEWRDPGQLCPGPHRKEKGTDKMGLGCAYKSE